MAKKPDDIIGGGCEYCNGTLPTVVIKCVVPSRICRACILVALQAIEDPSESPAVIEDRDGDLELLRQLEDA